MSHKPVLMLVDLVADRFITGTPKRISREAPVLILDYEGDSITPGGGANAIANVAALGGRPLALGVIGEDDDSGRAVVIALQELGVDTGGIVRQAAYRTPTKIRVLGGGRHSIKQQIVRIDIEDRLAPEAVAREAFASTVERAATHPTVAVISDYGYGAATPGMIDLLRAGVGDAGQILGDSRHRLDSFVGLDGATPNEEEAEELLGQRLNGTSQEVATAVLELRDRLAMQFLLVTRGRQGMALAIEDDLLEIPVHGTDQVADVTGAGDTVIGTFALALAAGATPVEAAFLANYAGGVVVMKMGTATVSGPELVDAVSADARPREEARWARS